MQTQTLTVVRAPTIAGETGDLVIRITDAAGQPVNTYDQMHEASMHLFSVDMKGLATPLDDFQHTHPEFLGDGTWRLTNFTAPSGGMDHIVADYSTGGRMTLAQASLSITGTSAPQPVHTGGYATQVTGMSSGPEGPIVGIQLTGPDGRPVTQLDTFMGAVAHMILFRPAVGTTELEFSHGHAETAISSGQLQVETSMLTAGAYQGWLQFTSTDGQVHAVPVAVTM